MVINFFLLLTTYRNFGAKTEDILQTKNSYFHINLIEVEKRKEQVIFLNSIELCQFLNWHLESGPLLCQENFCFTNIRSAGYMGNTGNENQHK